MSLSSAICKLFTFVLKLFKLVVTAIAEAVKMVVTAVVDVLDTLVSSVADAFFGGSSLLTIGVVGFVAYLLLSKKEEKYESARPSVV